MLLALGARASVRVNNVLSAVNLVTLLFIVIAGATVGKCVYHLYLKFIDITSTHKTKH